MPHIYTRIIKSVIYNHYHMVKYYNVLIHSTMDFLVGGLAGVGAGFFSNPFDVVKTRMQLQGELRAKGQHAVYYKNIPHAMYTIVKHDGVSALQKGLVPALWFQLVVNGVR